MQWQAGKRQLCIVQMDRVQHIATDESACLKVSTDAVDSLQRARTDSGLGELEQRTVLAS